MRHKASTAAKVPARKTRKSSRTAVKILSAPQGPRTVSHSALKKAVKKLFRERRHVDA